MTEQAAAEREGAEYLESQIGQYRCSCIATSVLYKLSLLVVESPALDQRIRELCSKALAAEEPELEPILSELRAALREHAQFVRQMAAAMLNRESKKDSQAA